MAGEEKGETTTEVKPTHAVLNVLVEYSCPHCGDPIGEPDEFELSDKNNFYQKIESEVKVNCGTCKKELFHDAIILRTLSERKP